MKFSKAKGDGKDIAMPLFGCKSHVAIDRRFGFIRASAVTDAARHDVVGSFPKSSQGNNTGLEVRAETAYCSQANEEFLK
ncbi:MAG: hypothetical protein HRT36_04165 [Alphaproteobacteria bacterium]|nr:hypothetical protein [Alphaproteobacteria bacterium]